jgi:hypothetical protein
MRFHELEAYCRAIKRARPGAAGLAVYADLECDVRVVANSDAYQPVDVATCRKKSNWPKKTVSNWSS